MKIMPITVLSLFDGMSCGMVALERAGIPVAKYFASEVDKPAIKVSNHNYPDIVQVGDVTKISYKDGVLYTENGNFNVGTIDLVIGGSPCQSFSNLGDGSGFDGKSGLFFHWLRIKNEVNPKYWLLENVTMKKQWEDHISMLLGTRPIKINSSLVSAQVRNRLYWSSGNIEQPIDKNIQLSDIIKLNVDNKYFLSEKAKKYIVSKDRLKKKLTDFATEKSVCLPARYTALNGSFMCVDCNGKIDTEKSGTLTARYGRGVASFGGDSFIYDLEDVSKERIRRFTPEECEQLQTVPIGYTSIVADTHRYRMLGNGWTVDVIAHIFDQMFKGSI